MLTWLVHPHRVKQVLQILNFDIFNFSILLIIIVHSLEQRLLLRGPVVVHIIK